PSLPRPARTRPFRLRVPTPGTVRSVWCTRPLKPVALLVFTRLRPHVDDCSLHGLVALHDLPPSFLNGWFRNSITCLVTQMNRGDAPTSSPAHAARAARAGWT